MSPRYRIEEVAQIIAVDRDVLVQFIENHWIEPVEFEQLDHEDLARARLIAELTEDFGVNAEAVPIILHLIDQLHRVHASLSDLQKSKEVFDP